MVLEKTAPTGQQRKRPDIHAPNAGAVVPVADVRICAASGKQHISADNLFGAERLVFFTVIDGIPVAVHLVDGIGGRIIAAGHFGIFRAVLFFEITVQPSVVDDAVLGVVQIGQHHFAGSLADVEHDIRPLFRGGGLNPRYIAARAAACPRSGQDDS